MLTPIPLPRSAGDARRELARCRVHNMRNPRAHPERIRAMVSAAFRTIFAFTDPIAGTKRRDEVPDMFEGQFPESS